MLKKISRYSWLHTVCWYWTHNNMCLKYIHYRDMFCPHIWGIFGSHFASVFPSSDLFLTPVCNAKLTHIAYTMHKLLFMSPKSTNNCTFVLNKSTLKSSGLEMSWKHTQNPSSQAGKSQAIRCAFGLIGGGNPSPFTNTNSSWAVLALPHTHTHTQYMEVTGEETESRCITRVSPRDHRPLTQHTGEKLSQ